MFEENINLKQNIFSQRRLKLEKVNYYCLGNSFPLYGDPRILKPPERGLARRFKLKLTVPTSFVFVFHHKIQLPT